MRRKTTFFLIAILCLGILFQSRIETALELVESTHETGIQIERPTNSLSLDVSEQMWNLTLGGSNSDYINAMSNCSDGGYIMVGYTSSYGVSYDLWLVKVAQDGTFLWNRTYNKTFLVGQDVIECADGGFAIAGYYGDIIFNKEMFLLRTDADGNHLWNNTFGYTGDDTAQSVLEISTGGFLLSGVIYEADPSNHAGILLWTDASGNHVRNATYTFSDIVYLMDAIECSTGGFLTVGTRMNGWPEILAMHVNNYGSIYWFDFYGAGYALSVIENIYGRYSLTGVTTSGTFFKELNTDGEEQRSVEYTLGTPNSYGAMIVEHPLGGYVIVGGSNVYEVVQNTTILRIGAQGNELWNASLDFDILSGSGATGVFVAEDNSIVVAGTRDMMGPHPNGYLLSMPSFYWVDSPEDVSVERDMGYTLDANTSMDIFADTWWLGNTLLEVDEDGFITTPAPLPLGDLEFNLYVMDPLGREISANFWLHVEDNLAPQWITPPTNQEHEFGTIFEYDLQAVDTSGVTYWISDTDNFEHLGDGYIVSSSVLPLGEYPLRMNVSDTYGNMASALFTITVSDATTPSLDSPQDIIKEYSVTGSILQWTCSDLLPDYFIITRNAVTIESGAWNGTNLEVRLDGLALGAYTFSLFVNDTSGNSAEDGVIVTIADLITPTIDHPADIWYLEGSLGNMITWSPDDLFPTEYSVFVNGVEAESEDWDGSSISYSADGLAVGVHNFTLVVIDINGNSAIDSVQVAVIDWPDGLPTTTTASTNTTDPFEYIRGVEGALGLGLIVVGSLAGLAIIVGVINIQMMRKMKSGK
ncbi:MAG: hypothetical protein ACFFAY_10275 [Promethearchaeota archaeon]